MLESKKLKSNAGKMFAAISMAITMGATAATATELPDDKLAAPKCGDSASESCCQRWVDTVISAAHAEADPSSMLNVLPRRIERWMIIEKRTYCAVKKDIEGRARQTLALAAK